MTIRWVNRLWDKKSKWFRTREPIKSEGKETLKQKSQCENEIDKRLCIRRKDGCTLIHSYIFARISSAFSVSQLIYTVYETWTNLERGKMYSTWNLRERIVDHRLNISLSLCEFIKKAIRDFKKKTKTRGWLILTSWVNLCLEVRELHSLYIYINIFWGVARSNTNNFQTGIIHS